jgi:hypothetical protein
MPGCGPKPALAVLEWRVDQERRHGLLPSLVLPGQIPPDFLDRLCLNAIGWWSSEVNLRRCSPLDLVYFWKKFPLPH